MNRADTIGTSVASIMRICDENNLVWEWDDDNGGIVIWAKDIPSLFDLMTDNTDPEAVA